MSTWLTGFWGCSQLEFYWNFILRPTKAKYVRKYVHDNDIKRDLYLGFGYKLLNDIVRVGIGWKSDWEPVNCKSLYRDLKHALRMLIW